ncbi:hypothetical protein XU18_2254 [Perkinsela sp. CCAP 1560/4]|nr:hypothetical protein XU18_2254 [Perkinsela sp. CCAP 1560/4]|eukprot:KNH06983.1 hypothetical protein XU18_2254 [Perkinsela sp. CCAP 1560/4]
MTNSSVQDTNEIDPSSVTDTLKLLLIGDSAVGKSCLLCRFTKNEFDTSNLSTIGIDFKVRYLYIDDLPVKLELWDTAGQERFRSITNAYYRGADGIAVVFDATNRESFKSVEMWSDNIYRLNSDASENPCFKVLIGNKIDLQDRRIISKADAEDLAKKIDMPYFETSAKNGAGVENAFITFVTEIVREKRKKAKQAVTEKRKSGRLHKKKNDQKDGCC